MCFKKNESMIKNYVNYVPMCLKKSENQKQKAMLTMCLCV
jgi:hypothetical protein